MFMEKRFAFIALAILVAATTLSCKPDAQCEAEQLLESASRLFAEKQYNKALWKIDSLRKVYPTAIEVRKKALKLHQSISLQQTREELALTDSALQATIINYQYLKTKVDKDREQLRATPEELEQLTLMRIKRDSLQTCYDVQCKKIKYILKKQKEI
jgi:hypothetical protein